MPYIMDFLMSIHVTTPEAQADLTEAWRRYAEQMQDHAFCIRAIDRREVQI